MVRVRAREGADRIGLETNPASLRLARLFGSRALPRLAEQCSNKFAVVFSQDYVATIFSIRSMSAATMRKMRLSIRSTASRFSSSIECRSYLEVTSAKV